MTLKTPLISPFDGQLRSEVSKVQTRLLEIQNSLLYGQQRRKGNCTCSPEGLCSFHAEIFNNLDDAIKRTRNVIDSIDNS